MKILWKNSLEEAKEIELEFITKLRFIIYNRYFN